MLAASGCAALPWSALQAPLPGPTPPGTPSALLDLRGALHVHTADSHDSPGTLAEVIAGARAAGLDWVAFSEHTRGGEGAASPGEASSPMDGKPLRIPGWEIRAEGGSILAIGVRERPPRFADGAAAARWVHERGGLAFVGHAERSRLMDPERYAAAGLDGVELVNLHARAEERPLALAAGLLLGPASRALRGLLEIPPRNLERWEALPGPPPIAAGVDAHAKFRLLVRWGTLDRYRDLFRTATTHVQASAATEAAVLEALRAGRSYLAFEGLAPVDRFEIVPVGRAIELRAPRRARLVLVCDGVESGFQWAAVARLRPPPGARRCRGEAWLGERLWILSSYRSLAGSERAPEPTAHEHGPAR